MTKDPLFIVGVGRSGTTLLRLMMNSHPNIAIPYESHFMTDYFQSLERYGNLEVEHNLRALLKDILAEKLLLDWDYDFDLDEVADAISGPVTLGSVFDAVYSLYARSKGKTRWGDKSDYLNRMHLVNKIYPNAKFVHIVRDGRSVVNSVMRLPWGPNDVVTGAKWWHEHVQQAQIVGSVLGERRYHLVRYEDLVADSVSTLTAICDFIGEDYSPEMLQYHEATVYSLIPVDRREQHHNTDKPPKLDRVHAWKQEMSNTHQAAFARVCTPSLVEFGYEVADASISDLHFNKLKVMAAVRGFIDTRHGVD